MGSARRKRLEAQLKGGLPKTAYLLWEEGKINMCGICGRPILDRRDATVDHIVPISQGGDDSWENVQLAHNACNHNAGSKLPRKPRGGDR